MLPLWLAVALGGAISAREYQLPLQPQNTLILPQSLGSNVVQHAEQQLDKYAILYRLQTNAFDFLRLLIQAVKKKHHLFGGGAAADEIIWRFGVTRY